MIPSDEFYNHLIEGLMLIDSRKFHEGWMKIHQLKTFLTDGKLNMESYIQMANNLAQCYVYRLEYKYDELTDLSSQTMQIAKKMNDNALLAISTGENLRSSVVNHYVSIAIDQLENLLPLLTENNREILYARWKVVNILGEIYTNIGQQTQSMRYGTELVQVAKQLGNKEYISRSLNNLAIAYELIGKFTDAMNAYTESLGLSMEIGDELGVAITSGNMGFIDMFQGKWDIALERFFKTRAYFQSIEDIPETIYWQNNIAKLYLETGEYWLSKTLLEENIALMRFYKLDQIILYPYFDYFLVCNGLGLVDEMHNVHEIMRDITSKHPENKLFEHYILIGSAILLRRNQQMHKAYVEEILDHLINEEIVDFEITTLATITRCEMYLEDLVLLESDEDEELVAKITHLLTRLDNSSKENQLIPLMVFSEILLSQFLAVTGQFQDALDYLNSAIQISVENGLKGLLREAKKKQEGVEEEILKIYERIGSESTIRDRLDDMDIDLYLERIKNFRLFK